MFKKILFVSLLLAVIFIPNSFYAGRMFASAQDIVADQAISLKSGFNFVSFTVAPPSSPSGLISKNSNIEDVYLYSAAAGSFLSAGEGTLTSLAVGKGYIIKSKADTSITITGPPAGTVGDISLKKGFNLLGFSKLPASNTLNAFTKLMNASSAIAGIYKWSPAAGSFIQVVRDSEGNVTLLDGGDPSLKPGEAYFVNVTEDTRLNYDGPDVKLAKFFAGLYTDPASDTVAAGATYDLNKVKVYAVYSDGSTSEVSSGYSFAASAGSLSGKSYSAPKYPANVVFTVSYADASSGISADCYFTLIVAGASIPAVKTTTYKCGYKLAPNARVIDEETVTTYSAVTSEIVLVSTGTAFELKAGDVLIGYYGDGYLRKATAVSVQNEKIHVTTAQANLEDAFETLDYSYKGKLSTLHASSTASPGSPESRAVGKFMRSKFVMPSPMPERSIISKDKLKKILENASISVALTRADVSFDPVVECDIEISWFKLKRFLFAVGGKLSGAIEFEVAAAAAVSVPLKSEIEIFKSTPYVFSVGPVPFSFEWGLKCGAEASASAAGIYSYSNDWVFGVRIGAEYDGSAWKKINDVSKTSSAEDNFSLKGSVEVKAYMGAEFALEITGIAGPAVSVEIAMSCLAEMASAEKVDLTVSAGLSAGVSFAVELLSLTLAEFSSELLSLNWTLYERSVDFSVAPPSVKPPAGIYVEEQLVYLSATGENVIIKYTLDGVEPSAVYGNTYTAPFKIASSCKLKAIALKPGVSGSYSSSSSVTAEYTMASPDDPTLCMIKIHLTSGVPSAVASISPCTTPAAYDFEDEWKNSNFASEVPKYVYVRQGSVFKWTISYPNDTSIWKFIKMDVDGADQSFASISKTESTVTASYEKTIYSRYVNIEGRFKRYDSGGAEMYSLISIVNPDVSCGTFSITAGPAGDSWYPYATNVGAVPSASPGYIFTGWQVFTDKNYTTATESVVITTGMKNELRANFSLKKSAEVIVEPPGTAEKYELLRNVSLSYFPLPVSGGVNYFGHDWNLVLKAVPGPQKRVARVEADNGQGRFTIESFSASGAVEANFKSSEDVKIYIVTVAEN